MQVIILSLVLSLCFQFPVQAMSGSAVLSVDSGLYSEPDNTSRLITTLPGGSEISIVQRHGSWYRVITQSSENQGWVRSYDVQINPDINWLARLKRVISGRDSSETTNVATVGIRGLGPGDVKKARPDQHELKKLDRYRVSIEQGLQYAAAVPLKSNEVGYLDGRESTDTGGGNPMDDAAAGVGTVINGIGDSLDGAVKGLKGLFGGGGNEE